MAPQTTGRRTRRTGLPQERLPLAELTKNPQTSEDPAVAIDKLAQKLNSIDIQEHHDQPPQQGAASGKACRPKNPKPSKEPSNRKNPATPPAKQDQAEPLIVRRSRRGDKAISSHPLVGQYRVELTSSERRWCGKFALGISTEAQLGVRMTVEAFDELFAGAEGKAFNERNRWGNDSDFYDEQLDFVLRLWGARRGLGRLQLGVVRDFEGAFVNTCVPAGIDWDGEEEEEGGNGDVSQKGCRTVWIHNDNAALLGRPCNHYSGVVVLQKEP